MQTNKKIIANILAIICIQIFHCVVQALHNLSNIDIDTPTIFLFFVTFFVLFFLPFILGSIISIFILPKIFQVIIAQIIFIGIDYFYRIYMENNNIHVLATIIEWTLIANIASVFIVFFIKFGYEAYIWCIYRLQRK